MGTGGRAESELGSCVFICTSLSSLAVRVPHNSPASIAVARPESVAGTGFKVKPMVFLVLRPLCL